MEAEIVRGAVSGFIGSAVVMGLIGWLSRGRSGQPNTVRYSRAGVITFLIGFVFFAAIAIAAPFLLVEDDGRLWLYQLFFAAFALLCAFMLHFTLRHRVSWDDHGVTVVGLTKTRFAGWDELSLQHKPWHDVWRLQAASGLKVEVADHMMTGVRALVREAARRGVPLTRKGQAIGLPENWGK